MFKLIMLALLAALGWYCYDTGILTGFSNGFIPQVGKECELVGSSGANLYVAVSKDAMQQIISTGEMKSVDRIDDAEKLAAVIDSGLGATIPAHTKASILNTTWITVNRAPFQITKVKLLDGQYSGTKVWVKRDNVVDTPLQQLFAKFR